MVLSDAHTGESRLANVHRFPSLCTRERGANITVGQSKKSPGASGANRCQAKPSVADARKGEANTASARWIGRHSTTRSEQQTAAFRGPMKPTHTNVQRHC